ncbi:MAG: DNA mismatch repair protein MutS [Clostridia bacterium]|nr:DNA mismatch repair protein MutS [Clostridia bacterium]
MMTQYLATKEKYPDHILLYRLGDFYEMFFDDAKTASRELDLVLTGKDCGEEERAPMCGIPFHSAEGYITRLVERGYKVAVCEQLEDPALAKGLVKRDVVKIVTPGTAVGQNLTDETKNNYLASLYVESGAAAFAVCDISENTVRVTSFLEASPALLLGRITNEFCIFSPSELLINVSVSKLAGFGDYVASNTRCAVNDGLEDLFFDGGRVCEEQFKTTLFDVPFSGDDDRRICLGAVGALIRYLSDTQRTALNGITRLEKYSSDCFLSIDAASRRNLELCETMRQREKRGTLLWVLDKTCTAPGARLLRRFIEQPLTSCRQISLRQEAVKELFCDVEMKNDLRDSLNGIQDIERIMSKLNYAKASPRDLIALSLTLEKIPRILSVIENCRSEEIKAAASAMGGRSGEALEEIRRSIEVSIDPNAPAVTRDGGMIRPGYDAGVDELRAIINDTGEYLTRIENTEKELTGIKNLKVAFNRVFGYYIEVTNSSLNMVPDRYVRKQTLTNGERFITQELKELETRILGAKDKIIALENELFDKLVASIAKCTDLLQSVSEALSKLDVFASLAEAALKNNYVCPEVDGSDELSLSDARHPVIECLGDSFFVPNDVYLDCRSNRMAIITGPNMAGKSTYMRQTALIVIMAQIGSFVPAKSARIGIVDKIFTRVGASDDLASGQSTFMLEMNEVAFILKNATKRSLILYDEIGRGTSTYDGMSIARAVVEYTASKKLGARTLFATHYHELSELENTLEGVKNYNIATKKRGDDIIFLRKIVPGSADDSYGIEVAKLAGVPQEVIKRARVILSELESDKPQKTASPSQPSDELTLFDGMKDDIISELKGINPDTLTPIEALSKLYDLSKKAKET